MNAYTLDYVERNRLDAFCKTVHRNEARSYLPELGRRRDREMALDTLPQTETNPRTLYELDGTPHVGVDEYMKRRLQVNLTEAIVNRK